MPDPTGHVLIEEAIRFPVSDGEDFTGWRYRRDIGAWACANAPNQLLVSLDESAPSTPRPKPPMSKKADVETGEDLKGT